MPPQMREHEQTRKVIVRDILAKLSRELRRFFKCVRARPEAMQKLPVTRRVDHHDSRGGRFFTAPDSARVHACLRQSSKNEIGRRIISDYTEQAYRRPQDRERSRRVRAVTPDMVLERGYPLSCAPSDLIDRLYQSVVDDASGAQNSRRLHVCTLSSVVAQLISSTFPTTKPHMAAPIRTIAAEIPKASFEEPVRCTIRPASQGATMPDTFPIPFCRLVHRPASNGPANVCVMA